MSCALDRADRAELGTILRNFAFLQARCNLESNSPGVYDLLDFRFVESHKNENACQLADLISPLYEAAPLQAVFPRSLY
jgi:hypothetical protein